MLQVLFCGGHIELASNVLSPYRNVCSVSGEKIVQKGSLNMFTACHHSPAPGKMECPDHLNGKSSEVEERLDVGMMTRARRKELGLDVDELHSGDGCRKREEVNVRKTKKTTAGLLYCYRSCGISLDHQEMIHAGKWIWLVYLLNFYCFLVQRLALSS